MKILELHLRNIASTVISFFYKKSYIIAGSEPASVPVR